MASNLYIHFPFCRRKCSYCALYSRTGVPEADRAEYVGRLAAAIERRRRQSAAADGFTTIYFGGGSPALCDLRPLLSVLNVQPSTFNLQSSTPEFTVELHPLDVSEELLAVLKAGGVNRISMGVQSFDDATLSAMGRGYTVREAEAAFALVKRHFDNAGIDLIVGFPGDFQNLKLKIENEELRRFARLGMKHCSVYSLQNERGLKDVPDDDAILDGIRSASEVLKELGLERYEISNYAVPGYECRHNLAVWRGEDYFGLGEGACGRVGLSRTRGIRRRDADGRIAPAYEEETVTPDADRKERTLFRLRTREGLDASHFPEWLPILDRFVAEGLLVHASDACIYRLTSRGTEVCDAILAELV